MFHPPLANVAPNDWRLGGVSVSSIWVVNTVSGMEASVPRQFVGSVTEMDGPRLVVGLVKELELRDGTAWPRVRRVIEMPRSVESAAANGDPGVRWVSSGRATVVGIRLERRWNSSVGRFMLLSGAGAALVSILTAGVLRDWLSPPRNVSHRVLRPDLGLSSGDDYRAVTKKLGLPAGDRIASVSPNERLRALQYPHLKVTVLLSSKADQPERYVGEVDADWRVVQWVGSERSKTMLSRVPHF